MAAAVAAAVAAAPPRSKTFHEASARVLRQKQENEIHPSDLKNLLLILLQIYAGIHLALFEKN